MERGEANPDGAQRSRERAGRDLGTGRRRSTGGRLSTGRRRSTGRSLCTDAEAAERGFGDPTAGVRRRVLRETLDAFEAASPPDRYARLAAENLARWRHGLDPHSEPPRVAVFAGDWGAVTHSLTRQYGACFAVLNMANAFVPGGGYVEGAPAQEENMFRRSDCHFAIGEDEFDPDSERYRPPMTTLLTGSEGVVYLDTKTPRVCIRGPEDRSRADLGYAWLPDQEVFPYFELRAAAQDLRDGSAFDAQDARRRIRAQLDTLVGAGLRHAVLGAFGCGAFRNPAAQVARIYREEVASRASAFDVLAFAIFAPGYGPDNYTPFSHEFDGD